MIDEEVAKNLEAEMQAELEKEERLARQKEEETNIALIKSWDNTQAMMDAYYELAVRLQEEERGELTIKEKSRLFVELMDKRKKHFARLRAKKIKIKPPTKTQQRNQMYTELVKGSEKRAADEQVEAEVDNDQREAEMKMYMKIIPDDEIVVDAIPLAIKPPIIVD
nr:hypothetical protein [Tanacetum cinerariifolium]